MLDLIQRIPIWVYIAVIAHFAILGTVAYLILLERKTASWVQDRIGPNRVGPWGLLQPIADGLKFILKEDYRPAGVDKVLFTIAPGIMIIVIIISIAVLPWGGTLQQSKTISVPAGADANAVAVDSVPWGASIVSVESTAGGDYSVVYQQPFQIAKLNIGVLFILAVLSLAVYGVVIGGWASNNKYSFLGGLRATANMISYEIPLALAVLTVVIMVGSLDLGEIVERQAHYWVEVIPAWNVFTQPLAFLMFLVCIHAEANRAPFDMAEAEQELVGGYHTEYSAMRFALFFLAEYAGMITTSAVCVALFFGGWHLPGLTGPADNPGLTDSLLIAILRSLVFFGKTLVIIFIFMWVRWSLPRFRFDQLMMMAWRALIPMSLVTLLATAIVVWAMGGSDELYRTRMLISGKLAIALLVMNVVVLVGTLIVSRILPAPPETNLRVNVPGSRFTNAGKRNLTQNAAAPAAAH